MTTDTTDNGSPPVLPPLPPHRRARSLWPWLGSLGINGVLVAVLFFFGHSVFELDQQAERERTEEVRLREVARQELERQHRGRIELTKQQADLLQVRQRRETEDELRVHVEEMLGHRRQMERVREEAFDELRRRPLEEIVRQELEPVRREVEIARKKLKYSAEKTEFEEFRKKQLDRAEQAEKLEGLIEDTVANAETFNERRDEIVAAVRGLEHEAELGLREPRNWPESEQTQSEIRASSAAYRAAKEARFTAQKLREAINPEAMNDTGLAEDMTDTPRMPEVARDGGTSDPVEMYEAARQLEGDVARLHDDVKAAELAVSNNSSFGEAKAAVEAGSTKPSRPDLAAAIRGSGGGSAPSSPAGGGSESGGERLPGQGESTANQVSAAAAGKPSQTSSSSSNDEFGSTDRPGQPGQAGGAAPDAGGTGGGTTMADVRNSREAMGRAQHQVVQMRANTASMVAQALRGQGGIGGVDGLALLGVRQRAASQSGFADMTSFSGGASGGAGGSGSGGGDGPGSGVTDQAYDPTAEGADMVGGKTGPKLVIPEQMAKANALPGRVFTDDSARQGWLYLDTWWVIGPWFNDSKIDWEKAHPPEYEINFDAEYVGRKGLGVRWEFWQSDRIDITPPVVMGASTYYAYTEVYSDRERDVLVAVAADDAARLWVNGDIVWQEHGQSAWRMGEAQRLIRLRAGVNTVLLRLENGPAHAIWSVLLAPPQAVTPVQSTP